MKKTIFILIYIILFNYTAYAEKDSISSSNFPFSYDFTVKNEIQSWKSPFADALFWTTNQMGNWYIAFPTGASMWYLGEKNGDDDLRDCGKYYTQSLALSSTAVTLLKIAFGRARPFKKEGNKNFKYFQFTNDYWSFPSGHSALSFSMATVMSQYIDEPWAYIVFYSYSIGTMFSRIYYDRHWLSDTVGGALLGTLSGLTVLYLNDFWDKKKEGNKNFLPESQKIFQFSLSF